MKENINIGVESNKMETNNAKNKQSIGSLKRHTNRPTVG